MCIYGQGSKSITHNSPSSITQKIVSLLPFLLGLPSVRWMQTAPGLLTLPSPPGGVGLRVRSPCLVTHSLCGPGTQQVEAVCVCVAGSERKRGVCERIYVQSHSYVCVHGYAYGSRESIIALKYGVRACGSV